MKNIIVACGTGIATSTLVMQRLKEFLEKRSMSLVLKQCTYTEIVGSINEETAAIISSSNIGAQINGIPVLLALPYISGIGVEMFEEKLEQILNSK